MESASSSPNATVKTILSNEQFKPLRRFVSSMYCVPATSASVERIFSHGGIFMRPHRVVPGVSHVKKCDWLVKNMTDWRLEVDLGQLNDWRRLAVNMTGGGDFASALFFVTVSPMQCTTSSVVLELLLHVVNTLFSYSCLNLCIIFKQFTNVNCNSCDHEL